MVQGIGVDLIEISRIRQTIDTYGHLFLNKIFSLAEQSYCQRKPDPAIHYAVRFAAKEAVAKALGTGIGKSVNWTDIEIYNATNGQPSVKLSDFVSPDLQSGRFSISLSHTHTYAMAMVIIESV